MGMTILLTCPSALLLVDSVTPQAAVRWTVRPTTRWVVGKGRGSWWVCMEWLGEVGEVPVPCLLSLYTHHVPCCSPSLARPSPPHRDEAHHTVLPHGPCTP